MGKKSDRPTAWECIRDMVAAIAISTALAVCVKSCWNYQVEKARGFYGTPGSKVE